MALVLTVLRIASTTPLSVGRFHAHLPDGASRVHIDGADRLSMTYDPRRTSLGDIVRLLEDQGHDVRAICRHAEVFAAPSLKPTRKAGRAASIAPAGRGCAMPVAT